MAFSDPKNNIRQFDLYDGQVVADFGAGIGAYSIEAAKEVGESGRVYAVEVQKDLLASIKNRARDEGVFNIEVIWGDIERDGKTKIRDGLIDAVIVSNVLFQVEDKSGFIKEVRRVLKDKGKVLVVDWQSSFNGAGPSLDSIISYDDARALFEDNGFSFIKNISAGDHHYGFVVIKDDRIK